MKIIVSDAGPLIGLARAAGLDVIGIGRVIIAAKEKGLISNVTNVLDDLNKSGYRLSSRLYNKIKLISG